MLHPDLLKASRALEISLPHLEAAATNSEDVLMNFRENLPGILEECARNEGSCAPSETDKESADVVLLGSIARGESTSISDCDYFILQHGASPAVSRQLIMAAEQARQEAGYRPPGAQGVFGNIVIAVTCPTDGGRGASLVDWAAIGKKGTIYGRERYTTETVQ